MTETTTEISEGGKLGAAKDDVSVISMPAHVAIIMDGNRRWAESRSLPRSAGHRAGTENIREVTRAVAAHGVDYLTIYAFSTENWERPSQEIQFLMDLMGEVIDVEAERLHEEGVRIQHIGRSDRLSSQLLKAIQTSIELTKDNTQLTLNVAFDYGGRDEIVNAVRRIVSDGLVPDEITEDVFHRYLYTNGLPDPDLVIRTGGDMRLSNFLIWQAYYSEYYSTAVLWPDFDADEVAKAMGSYVQRKRRFGRL